MPASVKCGKPVILCVEDNAGYLRVRKAVLEKNGYSILVARTASQALEILRTSPVALVISDHMLGGTTGTGLAKEIRKIKPNLPVVLYSGTVPEHLGDANCFISKGEPVETFLAIIRDLVHRYLA